MQVRLRKLVCVTTSAVCFALPSLADQHCNAVDDAYRQAYSALSAMTGEVDPAVCEAELDVAREILETALTSAKACGCASLEAGVTGLIAQSSQPDYACWNRRQAVRTNLGNGILDFCCYGC